MQRRFHAVDDQGMAGVVAALKTHHACGGFSQPIDQFAFSFVAPLRTDNDHITPWHWRGFLIHKKKFKSWS
jgi:hypothetical protein